MRNGRVVPGRIVKEIIALKEQGEPLSQRLRLLDDIDTEQRRGAGITSCSIETLNSEPELRAELERYGCRVSMHNQQTVLISW